MGERSSWRTGVPHDLEAAKCTLWWHTIQRPYPQSPLWQGSDILSMEPLPLTEELRGFNYPGWQRDPGPIGGWDREYSSWYKKVLQVPPVRERPMVRGTGGFWKFRRGEAA